MTLLRLSTVVALASGLALASTFAAPGEIDALAGGEILSRPTDHGISVRAIAGPSLTASIEWGTTPGEYDHTSADVHADGGQPFDIVLDGLAPDTDYVYRLRVRPDGDAGAAQTGPERTFHTQRLAGSPFSFVVQADPHLDENSSPDVYLQTLRNELADRPDFLVDLGDAAMSDRCILDGETLCSRERATSYDQVAGRNALMRSYFARVSHSLPLFMVLGNHEGEAGWATGGAARDVALWGLKARTFHYTNPVPDGFYSGNEDDDADVGRRQNYYAFEWGDALFVVLDPFAYTTKKPSRYTDADMWNWTLGDTQYHWFERTLADSHARFKFVFSHHGLGSDTPEVRGGAAFAGSFEWGGKNIDGSWGFTTRRPGWSKPIHQLMVEHHVNIWFHGHDHLYAREELDGIVYQAVPQPSTARYQGPDLAKDYGYLATQGDTAFVTPGHLRVSVGTDGVRVAYVRSVAPGAETPALRNGAILKEYEVK